MLAATSSSDSSVRQTTCDRDAGETSPAAPPAWFWLLPLAVAVLRMLPFLATQTFSPPEGQAYLPVGFIPKDFLSYLAFIRQAGDGGSPLLVNPFTTEPQSPRFVLLFHWLLGLSSALTGHPEWLLELSRLPLAVIFFALLWRFLGPVLPSRQERLCACVLIAFSGGLESFLRPFVPWMPPILGQSFAQDTWEMLGWNTFAACFNPLWISGLIMALVTLTPILRPDGPRSWRDLLQISLGFLVCYLIHPYTAIGVLGIAATAPALEWLLGRQLDGPKHGQILAALVLPLLLIAALGRWQAQDPIYRQCASGIFGPQAASVFWYPITLGLLGVAAVRGGQIWAREQRSYRHAMLAWLVAVILLHTSPVLNGYKFVFLLHIPLCIVAAPWISRLAERYSTWGSGARIAALIGAAALVGPPLLITAQSVQAAVVVHAVPEEYKQVLTALATKPRGNVLSSPALGNAIPAFTPHHVWVGQWFLTPNYQERANLYLSLVAKPERARWEEFVNQHRIQYVVVPLTAAGAVTEALGTRVSASEAFGKLVVLTLASR